MTDTIKIRFVLLAGLLALRCHHHSGNNTSSGASSTVAAANVTGNWHGAVTINGTTTLMVFALAQSSTTVAGVDNVVGNWSLPQQTGTATGSVTTTTLTLTNLTEDPTPTCTGSFSGTANVFVSSMTLTFSGSETGTCRGAPGGTFSNISGTFFNNYL